MPNGADSVEKKFTPAEQVAFHIERDLIKKAESVTILLSVGILFCLSMIEQASYSPQEKAYYTMLADAMTVIIILQALIVHKVAREFFKNTPVQYQLKHLLESIRLSGVQLADVQASINPLARPYLDLQLWLHDKNHK